MNWLFAVERSHGTKTTCWWANCALGHPKLRFFVLDVPVSNFLTSNAFLYHVIALLQRAYYLTQLPETVGGRTKKFPGYNIAKLKLALWLVNYPFTNLPTGEHRGRAAHVQTSARQYFCDYNCIFPVEFATVAEDGHWKWKVKFWKAIFKVKRPN